MADVASVASVSGVAEPVMGTNNGAQRLLPELFSNLEVKTNVYAAGRVCRRVPSRYASRMECTLRWAHLDWTYITLHPFCLYKCRLVYAPIRGSAMSRIQTRRTG